jgi:hypothetical protein
MTAAWFVTRAVATRLALAAMTLGCISVAARAQDATSSSSTARAVVGLGDIDGSSLADPASPSPQYGGSGRQGSYKGYGESRFSHIAIEAGGGFSVPIGNDVNGGFTSSLDSLGIPGISGNYGTEIFGGNLLVGAGWKFSKRFTLMGEYQFNTNKIPGRTLSAEYDSNAANFITNNISAIGGNVHTNSVTAEPMFTYYNSDRHSFTGYVIGGVGYYHKTINFTAQVLEEDEFGDVFGVNQTFNSFGDSGVGANFGTGVAFKVFGPDSQARLFAEARYLFANTPRQTAADNQNQNEFILHTGTEELIPVTVGIRF